jgi:parallel beta-helix repeat protein
VLSGADRTVVAGNTVTECGQGGIYTQACTNLVVADNTVTGCQLRGIEVDGDTATAVGVSITGNVVTGCIGQINLVKARNVTVVGNRIENPDPARAVSCIAINVGTTKAVVVGNHAYQAHPTFPAMFVDSAATDVTMAWNGVNAGNPYQAPSDTVMMYRSAPGQVKTTAKLIAAGGIGVGNSAPATTLGSVVRKIEVFSSSGASLGWIPVYSSMT